MITRCASSRLHVLLLSLVLLALSSQHVVHSAKTVLTSSQRMVREERIQQQQQQQQSRKLQQNDKNNKDNDNNKNNDKNAGEPATSPPSLQPTLEPTTPPTLAPVVVGGVVDVPRTLAPSESPREEDGIEATVPTSSIRLSAEEIQEIQYFGGASVTVRLSTWFQDGSSANQVGGSAVETALLQSLHSLICQSDAELDTDTLVFDTLFDNNADGSSVDPEDRELCVVDTELWVRQISATVEGSILFQPPTTYVVDRTSADSTLRWTTWRVTWDVLRLGTSYIAQGLENAGQEAASLSQAEIYRAGVEAMQGILDLALQVSIREQSYDQLIVAALGVAGNGEPGLVLSSVYGEEVATFEPKIEWLGLADATPVDNDSPPGGEGAVGTNAPDHFEIVYPTSTAPPNVQVVETTDAEEDDDDDKYDDDRYSDVYGITEPIDPPFWHPLRIVGIVMFVVTSACLVFLSYMSKKRLARRDLERRQMAKEGGLLNNHQGVEDMLMRAAASQTTTMPISKTYTKGSDHDDDGGMDVPLPNNLQTH